MRKQTAIYWDNPVPDGFGGFTFDDGVEIECRWEDVVEIFVDKDGNEKKSRSRVFVDRVVILNGYLFRGEESDLDSGESLSTNPQDIVNAWPIQKYDELPNIRNTETLRTAWL